MQRFIIKQLLFSLPFFLIILTELILPIDFFSFRIWETIRVKKMHYFLPGPFYPNQTIIKKEQGELAPHTKYAIKKQVTWITDNYGHRNKNTSVLPCEIIIMGDSFVNGLSLSQKNMLGNILAKQLNVSVNTLYMPYSMDLFFNDLRFENNPPSIIIFSSVERFLFDIAKKETIEPDKIKIIKDIYRKRIKQNKIIQKTAIPLDRLFKGILIRTIKSRLEIKLKDFFYGKNRKYPFQNYIDKTMFFIQGDSANKDVSYEKILQIVNTLQKYQDKLKAKNINFIFLPLPNKENIYYKYLKTQKKPTNLKKIIKELKNRNINVIDTQKAFDKEYERTFEFLHHKDDTHWNSQGAKLTARLVKNFIIEHTLLNKKNYTNNLS